MARTPQNPNPPAATPAPQPPARTGNGAQVPARQQPSPIGTLRDLLEKSKGQIAMALPRHMTPERLIRVTLTAVQRVPKLLQCDPVSVVGCVIQAAELQLELAGALGQCYMVPFFNGKTRKNEAQFQVGYKGLLALAHRSGQVKHVSAHEVYSGDEFAYEYGSHPRLVHRPAMRNRGEVVAYYATLTTTTGGDDFEVMSKEDVERHRQKFSKAADSGPWVTNFDEMAKKTVLKRLLKRAPMSIEAAKAVALDEYAEAGADQGLPLVEVSTQERAAMLRERLAQHQAPAEEVPALEHQPSQDEAEHDPRAEEPAETREQLTARAEGILKDAGWTAERLSDHLEQAYGVKDTADLGKLTDEQLQHFAGWLELTRGK